MPAVLVKWKGYGEITNAHWRYSESKQPIETENYMSYTHNDVVNSSGGESKMLLVGTFDKDPQTGALRKSNTLVGTLEGQDGTLPDVPNGDKIEPEPPVSGPGYPPGWGFVIKELPNATSMYLFVPALFDPLGGSQVKLELQLGNEVGRGKWSAPFVYSMNQEGDLLKDSEGSDIKPIVVPSIIAGESNVVQWVTGENKIVQETFKPSWLDLEMEMFVKDPQGRLYQHSKVKTNQTIDLTFLTQGLYFVLFVCNGKTFVQQVVKQ